MKTETKRKIFAIAIFYVIAVTCRALAMRMEAPTVANLQYFIRNWAEGTGPCLGALVAVFAMKRTFFCTITGASIMKSVLSVAIPFVVCFFIHQQLSIILLGFILYSFLEEVGWRGYLLGELKIKNELLQSVIIGSMWLVWHINIGLNISTLSFLLILIFGSWGIGRIAKDTHSLVLCACFHTLFNFSNHGFFRFTPLVICLYVGIIASWFILWYTPWSKLFHNTQSNKA